MCLIRLLLLAAVSWLLVAAIVVCGIAVLAYVQSTRAATFNDRWPRAHEHLTHPRQDRLKSRPPVQVEEWNSLTWGRGLA